jgi:phosphatidylinositol 4-kinase B
MTPVEQLCRDIFIDAGLELWLEPYGIISTTSSTGMIETLTDALSLDAFKKKDGYVSLAHHFELSYGHDQARLAQAKRCFISSLAAYSLVCFVFLIKDRHNGNILLDTEGHMVHIDYGFILGIAPGGSFR